MYLLLCFYDQSGDHSEIIKHMARLVDSIEVPAAKAAILWVMGEYCERVPKIAPDVLRKMAKSFTNEDPAVKMQVNRLPTQNGTFFKGAAQGLNMKFQT